MRLKCIGGPNNGEWHEVHDNFRVGDCWRIAKKLEVSTKMLPINEQGILITNIEYIQYIFDQAAYRYNNNENNENKFYEFMYLRYEKLTRDEIMMDLLIKTFQ